MTHIYGMTGISYWYVVLAGMDAWNEELYLQNTIPWYGTYFGIEEYSKFMIPYHGME